MSIANNLPSLRAVRPEDEPFLYHLFSLVKLEELGIGHWDAAQREQLLRIQYNAHQLHHHSSDDCIVALGEQAIGRLIVQRAASAIQLSDITLLPEFRNQGIGARLIRALQEESRQFNRPLQLHVFKTNPVVDLYRRLGFRLVSSSDAQHFMEWKASAKED